MLYRQGLPLRSFRFLPILLVLLLLAACGPNGQAGSGGNKSLRIGAVFLDTQGFYGGVKKGFQDEAKTKQVTLNLLQTNTNDDPSAENSFASTMVSSKVDALIISAASATASVPAIRSAYNAGVPVICYNTCINQSDLQKYVYAYVVADPVKFGEMTGDVAANYFIKHKITNPKIGIVNCEFVEVCQLRHQGFAKALQAKVPGAQFVSNQAGTTADQAVSVAENILTAHPDLTAFYGESGGATIGAVKAVQARGKTGSVVVFGSDMTTDIAKALADGQILKGEVDVSGQVVGKLAFDQVLNAVNSGGHSTGHIIQAPIAAYTADNQAEIQNWLKVHADGLP
jgi:ABC-type sugar transport system substrate-binding protein